MSDKAEQLVKLAEEEFPDLLPAEDKMLRAAAKGTVAVCGPIIDQFDPELLGANLSGKRDEKGFRQHKAELLRWWRREKPPTSEKWGKDRTIRAKIIRWLCIDAEANKLVDPFGIQIYAARIEGRLNLAFVKVPFPIGLLSSVIPKGIDLRSAETRSLYFTSSYIGPDNGVSILADGLITGGDLFLRHGFVTKGEVRLLGAKIAGNLDCSGGRFFNPGGRALIADRAEIGGAAFLNDGFVAKGEVRLIGVKIAGQLVCRGGRFSNPGKKALNVGGAEISGGAFLNDGFVAKGEVLLIGAKIAGQLCCDGGQFFNPGGRALVADGAEIDGGFFLDDGFVAKGEVQLLGAKITGTLICSGGRFSNPGGMALIADGAEIDGGVFLNDGFVAKGEVRLLGAKIASNLTCRGGRFSNSGGMALIADGAEIGGGLFLDRGFCAKGKVCLLHARAGVLQDSQKCWPDPGELVINGFEYRAIVPATDAHARKKWLKRQYPAKLKRQERRGLFRPQPYEQLARVLRLAGHKDDAREILIAKENARRKYGTMNWWKKPFHWFFKQTVAYGYRPWLAMWWLAVFVLVGTWSFNAGAVDGYIVPAKERVYMNEPYKTTGKPPEEYPKFSAFVYSLDCFVPLVNLHQEDYWHPIKKAEWGWVLWGYLWFHIIAGWLLSFAVVAGITKAVGREEK